MLTDIAQTCLVCGKRIRLEECPSCPRVYHFKCVHQPASTVTKRTLCPQHNCWSCHHTASGAGGLLFSCRYCHRAFCEDCLDWKKTTFIGDEISEFQALGFGPCRTSYFISCEHCNKSSESHSSKRKLRKGQDNTSSLASKRSRRGRS